MKICPACNTQYTDDTLLYCLQDGSPLTPINVSEEMPTVVHGRPDASTAETVVSIPYTNDVPGNWRPAEANGPAGPGTGLLAVVAVTVATMLALFAIVAGGVWFFYKSGQPTTARNSTQANNAADRNANAAASPTPSVTPSASASPTGSPVPSPPVLNLAEVRREITNELGEWRKDAESLDLGSYMTHYAPTVDYYKRDGASLGAVRTDKQRAFSRYDAIDIEISNITVTVEGETATAIFDKEWDFSGSDDVSTGKVRQLMRFKKIGGDWRITAEKDLKVYYSR